MAKLYVTLTVGNYIVNAVSFLAVNVITVFLDCILQSETRKFKNNIRNTMALDSQMCDYIHDKFLTITFSELDAIVQVKAEMQM